MSTEQNYVGGGNYAIPLTTGQPFRGHSYRMQTYLVVSDIARLTGEDESKVWKRVYQQVNAMYAVNLHSFPRGRNESLLRVAERHDVLDKVYAVAYVERLQYQE
ncbi:hypothetical protein IC229_05905 [Spirosoma sp. BT702]|uniref:Uncharacterized protein n=1 Tax=Spirosoma profusum TaxID=2771354 RepID=A0A926Y1C6_9BACT|nr:hypothetical protein [Spirosoma profusum]MBD2700160.1 hypothetical protein [Spirosoma profusum]